MIKLTSRKQAASYHIQRYSISERTACRLLSVSRTAFRYQPEPGFDDLLHSRLKELASRQLAYGYLLLHGILKAEGLVVNKKRTYRIYTEEELQIRIRKRKKLHRARQPILLADNKALVFWIS